ncbi:hypothetical protein L3i20_v222460 [Paenibacillus sp. L3-i20]|nr:hypothetical protein L3i20_v222460 [Paenibacillus sp. L3-i20]
MTVDLSPEFNTYWGDYARTLLVTNGKAIGEDELVNNNHECESELINGVKIGVELHHIYKNHVKPEMTFEEVYLYMNEAISQHDYINLDFIGNLGHTIEFNKDHRRYFELGNKTKLNEVELFTFEPHIKHKNGQYGFKREDIYYFRDGELVVI